MDEQQKQDYNQRERRREKLTSILSGLIQSGADQVQLSRVAARLRDDNRLQLTSLAEAMMSSEGPQQELYRQRKGELELSIKRIEKTLAPFKEALTTFQEVPRQPRASVASVTTPSASKQLKATPSASVVDFELSPAVSGVKGPDAYTDQTLEHTPVVDRTGNVSVQPTGRRGRAGRGRGQLQPISSTELLSNFAREIRHNQTLSRELVSNALLTVQKSQIARDIIGDLADSAVDHTEKSQIARDIIGDLADSAVDRRTEKSQIARDIIGDLADSAVDRRTETSKPVPVPAPEPGPIPGISEIQDRLSRRGEDLKRRVESVSSVSTDDVKEIQSELAKGFTDATNSMDALARTTSKLDGASSEVRIQLLEELQRNSQLQALVKAGLMRWDDLMIKNPPATDSNHVSNPDGDNPEYVIDRTKLVDLQRKLSDYASKQSATLGNLQQTIARRRTTPGVVPSASNAIYPGMKVWTPVAWAPALKPGQ